MTLIVLEGVSASGKSTIRDKLLEKHPEWVMWKGENLMRKGMGEYWLDYQRRYHEALHRLYELNPENVIIADRAFSDCAYNSDAQIRKEMRRLVACYGNVAILYFYPGTYDPDELNGNGNHSLDGYEILQQRGSRDLHQINTLMERYNKLLQMFRHHVIDTSQDISDCVTEASDFIRLQHETQVHKPDA
jgi:hypothetical protein